MRPPDVGRQLALGRERSTTTIEGSVDRVLHRNEESGWGVLLIDVEEARDRRGRGTIKAVGSFLGVRPGESLRLEGDWVEHPKFGPQFKVTSYSPAEPASLEGIERYLASFIDGIGADLAKKIVGRFGNETLDVFAKEPHRLTEIHGVGKKRKKQILAAWNETRTIRDAMVFLQSFGVSSTFAIKIYQRFEDGTVEAVRANPYCLTEVRGIGFHRADAVARAQGKAHDSPQRVAAGLVHVLDEASGRDGHMFLPRGELVRRTRDLLGVGEGVVVPVIEAECREGRLRNVGESIYVRGLEKVERIVAERLRALLAAKAPPLKLDVEMAIGKFEELERISLAEAQRQTLREMVESKVMVLTGGPGTGKTTLTKAIVYVATLTGLSVQLAAPTGRAAKRLSEATGVEAKTLHRMLGYQRGAFVHGRDDPIEADLFVIDEASMLDAPLARRLLDAVPDTARLVFVGDVDQLPSVGPGRVLGDLIDSGVIPVVRLTEIFRQAQKSLIVVNAHRVIHGDLPVRGQNPEEADFFVARREDAAAALAEIRDLVVSRIPARFGFGPLRDIQVLAPMRRGILGVENLNAELQNALNPRGEARKWSRGLRAGDRVMQTSNNYDLEVFNGEIGTVTGFDSENNKVLVAFDVRHVAYPIASLEELELAYAVTIHKSQGSEFPCVVIALHRQHFVMLQRNLLYTAITRGKRLVLVVGSPQALAVATRTETTQRRETLLVERLQGLGAS